MKEQKISGRSILKLTVSTLWAHIWLYAQIVLCAAGVMLVAPYLKQYIESTEFIPSGHLDTISQIIFEYIFKFWFWGACVVIAAHIVRTGNAYFSDFIRSLKYTPSFTIIQSIVALPMVMIGQLISILQRTLPTEVSSEFINPHYIAAYWICIMIIGPVLTCFALGWQLYGQLAVPIFVIEKQGILKSITASLQRSHCLLWKIIEINFTWIAIATVTVGIIVGASYVSTGNTLRLYVISQPITSFDLPFQYPFLALAYVYLYTQSRSNSEINN